MLNLKVCCWIFSYRCYSGLEFKHSQLAKCELKFENASWNYLSWHFLASGFWAKTIICFVIVFIFENKQFSSNINKHNLSKTSQFLSILSYFPCFLAPSIIIPLEFAPCHKTFVCSNTLCLCGKSSNCWLVFRSLKLLYCSCMV